MAEPTLFVGTMAMGKGTIAMGFYGTGERLDSTPYTRNSCKFIAKKQNKRGGEGGR